MSGGATTQIVLSGDPPSTSPAASAKTIGAAYTLSCAELVGGAGDGSAQNPFGLPTQIWITSVSDMQVPDVSSPFGTQSKPAQSVPS
jgi:hypothetical protein